MLLLGIHRSSASFLSVYKHSGSYLSLTSNVQVHIHQLFKLSWSTKGVKQFCLTCIHCILIGAKIDTSTSDKNDKSNLGIDPIVKLSFGFSQNSSALPIHTPLSEDKIWGFLFYLGPPFPYQHWHIFCSRSRHTIYPPPALQSCALSLGIVNTVGRGYPLRMGVVPLLSADKNGDGLYFRSFACLSWVILT